MQKLLPNSSNKILNIRSAKIKSLVELQGRKRATKSIRNEYIEKYKNVNIINTHTGINLKLSKRGIKDTLCHGNNNAKLATIEFIANLLVNGKLINQETDLKGRPIKWIYLKNIIILDDHPQIIILDIKKDQHGCRFYNHTIKNNITGNPSVIDNNINKNLDHPAYVISDNNIPQ